MLLLLEKKKEQQKAATLFYRVVDAKQSFSTSIKEEFILKNTNFPVDDSLKAADDTIEQSTFDCEKNTGKNLCCT